MASISTLSLCFRPISTLFATTSLVLRFRFLITLVAPRDFCSACCFQYGAPAREFSLFVFSSLGRRASWRHVRWRLRAFPKWVVHTVNNRTQLFIQMIRSGYIPKWVVHTVNNRTQLTRCVYISPGEGSHATYRSSRNLLLQLPLDCPGFPSNRLEVVF